MVDNVYILKYQPYPFIMAMLVLRATNIKKEEYDYVF